MTALVASKVAGMFGLMFFMAFFLGVVVMLLRPGAREEAARHALIPFKEEDPRG